MRRSKQWVLAACGALVMSFTPSPADGYRIILDQVHETLTRAAVDCLARSAPAAPAGCAMDRSDLNSLARHNNSEFKDAVRWPDNPLRQSNAISGPHNYLNVVIGRCAGLIERHADNLQNAGLACRSHWGDLQFFHAMRSSRTESAAETRTKILDWARFAYRVARGDVPADANFCAQFRSGSSIDAAMVPPNFPYCSVGHDGWTVGEFFTLSCPTQPLQCNVNPRPDLVRRTATGAILHLIQDSYSQSHVMRTDAPLANERGELLAAAECGAPRSYEHYNRQTERVHGRADGWPRVGASCGATRDRDDPITASATALYYLREGRSPDDLITYLSTRVF
jgi:hypothetical protein